MFLHGGDYNPEQWIEDEELFESDLQKLKDANINTVTIGMFSWSTFEKEEEEFNLEWFDYVLSEINKVGMKVILGTPTAARPHWLAQKYPETSRVNKYGQRELSGIRHNHCPTNIKFREKAKIIIRKQLKVALKYDNIHSFHINNEFGGDCYCNDCQNKFRKYLKKKYDTIDELNKAWWNTFWSHNYSSFEEIEAPFKHGEQSNTPLKVNWEKFRTDNHIDYFKFEYKLIRKYSDLPITTNFHGFTLDYYRFAKYVDYISFDMYPKWNYFDQYEDNYEVAIEAKMTLASQTGLDKHKDFYMMESTPGSTNWQEYTILKSDKLHYASTFLQMLAGSKSYLYFQLKQSRGSSEKYHGAVLDINSDTNSRTYKYCTQFGQYLYDLEKFSEMKLTKKVGVYYDWNNETMLNHSEGPRNKGLDVKSFIKDIFSYFNNANYNIEFFYDETQVADYEIVIFPYSYNVKDEVIARLKQLTNKKVIAFPMLNYVNGDDLLHLGNIPHNLDDCFGMRTLEFNAVIDNDTISSENYDFEYLTEVVETNSATSLESFKHNILGSAVSKNEYNNSEYYYIAGIPTYESLFELMNDILGIETSMERKLLHSEIELNNSLYDCVINFGTRPIEIDLDKVVFTTAEGELLEEYDFMIVRK